MASQQMSLFDLFEGDGKERIELIVVSCPDEGKTESRILKGDSKKMANPVVVSEDNIYDYWQLCLDVVNAWAKYQAKKNLYINASHDETRHMVWDVVQKYYDGSLVLLARHEAELSEAVDAAIYRLARASHTYNVEPINREWLYRNLESAKDYKSYREKCKRRQKKRKPIESLRDL